MKESTQVLIVEDEAITAQDLQQILKGLGYTVTGIASRGEDALRQVAKIVPDLVLMDVRLPGKMDGIEAAAQIRSRFQTPVVFLTAYADQTTVQRAKITSPLGYILKPFDEQEIHATIEIALYRAEWERQIQDSEQWLNTTINGIADGIIATDLVGRITFLNSSAELLTGWTKGDGYGKPVEDILQLLDFQTRRPVQKIAENLLEAETKPSPSDPTILLVRDGTERLVAYHGSPIEGNSMRRIGIVIVFRDITKWYLKLADPQKRQKIMNGAMNDRFHFTEREKMVIEQLSNGCKNKQIADKLGIAEDTVKEYIKRIMRKTGVATRTGILRRVFELQF